MRHTTEAFARNRRLEGYTEYMHGMASAHGISETGDGFFLSFFSSFVCERHYIELAPEIRDGSDIM